MRYIYLFFALVQVIDLYGQREKLLPMPSRFLNPIYDKTNEFLKARSGDVPSDRYWTVMSDRSGVDVFDKPSEAAERVGILPYFKNFLVIAESEDWLRIASFDEEPKRMRLSNDDVVLGWVRKREMLLWQRGIRDRWSGISKKVFLINTDAYYDNRQFNEGRDRVDVRNGPGEEADIIDKIGIYGFYFVYKIEEVGNKEYYLIGRDYEFFHGNADRNMIGWVDGNRCAPWDSRICFEPNFLEAAIAERSKHPETRALKGFRHAVDCREYVSKGTYANPPVWDGDPALVSSTKPGILIRQDVGNERRFRWPGQILRIPLVSAPIVGDLDNKSLYISTGVAGDIVPYSLTRQLKGIDPLTYGGVEQKVKKYSSSDKDFKIVLLLEASELTQNWMQQQLNAFLDYLSVFSQELNGNLRFGIVVYRDNMENPAVSSMGPDTDLNTLREALQNHSLRNLVDLDVYDGVVLFEALDRALNMCNDFDNNIFVMIGGNADIRLARGERSALVSEDVVLEKMIRYLPSFFVWSHHDDNLVDFSLAYQIKDLVLKASTRLYQWYASLLDIEEGEFPKVNSPSFQSISLMGNGQKLSLQSFINASILQAEGNRAMNDQIFIPEYDIFFKELLDNREKNSKAIITGVLFGESFSESFVSSAGISSFGLAHLKRSFEPLNPKEIALLSKEKIKLFLPVYVPYRIKNAENATLSTILFMPEQELIEYVAELERLQDQLQSRVSTKEKGKAVSDSFCQLYYRLLGENSGNKRNLDCSQVNLGVIRKILHGSSDLSFREMDLDEFNLGRSWGINPSATVSDIKELSEQQLQIISENLNQVLRYLNIDVRNNYNFMFESGMTKAGVPNRYYWIPLRDAF